MSLLREILCFGRIDPFYHRLFTAITEYYTSCHKRAEHYFTATLPSLLLRFICMVICTDWIRRGILIHFNNTSNLNKCYLRPNKIFA